MSEPHFETALSRHDKGNAGDLSIGISEVERLSKARRVRDYFIDNGIPVVSEDTWGGDIVFAAVMHVAATVKPNLLEAVWTSGSYIEENYDPVNGIKKVLLFDDLFVFARRNQCRFVTNIGNIGT